MLPTHRNHCVQAGLAMLALRGQLLLSGLESGCCDISPCSCGHCSEVHSTRVLGTMLGAAFTSCLPCSFDTLNSMPCSHRISVRFPYHPFLGLCSQRYYDQLRQPRDQLVQREGLWGAWVVPASRGRADTHVDGRLLTESPKSLCVSGTGRLQRQQKQVL